MISPTQIKVAREKQEHPERFCPRQYCLWKTGGFLCPRHDTLYKCDKCKRTIKESEANNLTCPCGGSLR